MSSPTISTTLPSSDNNSTSLNPMTTGVKIAAYLVVLIFSLIGNSLLVAIVYKNANKRMRTPSNYFIVNMALADILVVAYAVPQNIVLTVYNFRWLVGGVAGQILCRFSFFVTQLPILVSTGSLLIVALDRYFLVFYPMKRIITIQIARRIIITVWSFTAVFTAPLFALIAVVEVPPGILYCAIEFKKLGLAVSYFLFCYTTIIAIPLVIIIALYVAIGFKISRAAPPGNQLPSTQERRERITHKVLAMLSAIVAALILFRLPLVIGLIVCFSRFHHLCGKIDLMFITWFLTLTNSTLNPWIYFIFNDKFRHGARLILEKFFPCCFKGVNGVEAIQNSTHQMVGLPVEHSETVHQR
ncbi:hypothetical protein pdam_00008074 [Pocillopora damicornis]|uniref:G-protein coupled receptors family 1 profile domain-containing protein n=1 Tax=Pocillopora damicornis TaxID=46731 RepID=A0A3M6TEA9_POCDA|nr:neuropeptide SIFamide receptor-like [Pocillopora damicornis]RMX39678.1 hypothetical protein pdam_00008074 [Pocillopora damicornis]